MNFVQTREPLGKLRLTPKVNHARPYAQLLRAA